VQKVARDLPAVDLDIHSLLAQGMGLSLHWFPADTSGPRLAGVLVGMANTAGGTILLGISPRSANIQGVPDTSEANDRIFEAALMAEPALVLPIPRLVQVDQAQVLVVTVPPGLPHVYSLEGRYLGREGSQTNPLSARQLRQLLLERGAVQFESQVPGNASLDDLDWERVAEYLKALEIPEEESPVNVLIQRGCLGRDLRPTYATLLLFGKHPQQWLPNATILATRFPGVAYADRFFKKDITGTLPDQLRQVEAFTRQNLSSVVRLVGLTRQETTEYPLEAVREILVNAVAHRDYNLQGDNIHLNIFADRIEVQSPGGLPGPVTLDNLLDARFSRNAVLVQVLSDLGFVERLGYGLDRVVKVMQQHNLRPPRFEEVAGTFRVTLYGETVAHLEATEVDLEAYQDYDFNPRQQIAIGFLTRYKRITSRDLQDLCPEVHPETLRRDLADLVVRDLLIKVGDKRATYYILKK
jgi:ATP-dependent DNA helicase RecG